MYICYILPVPANDIAIENIFFYTFWFKYQYFGKNLPR